jgi:hypothetical protein
MALLHKDGKFLATWRVALSDLPAEPERGGRESIGSWYVSELVAAYARNAGQHEFRTWVDHSPNNLRHIPILSSAFPRSKFIHLVRDGRAVAASVMPLDWGPSEPIEAAKWWTSEMAHGLAAESCFPGQVIQVRYEKLVSNPEEEAHLSVRWDRVLQ